MMKLLMSLLLACTMPVAEAAWQTKVQGRYTYFEDGYSQAFPVGDKGAYYVTYLVGPGQWLYYHPDYAFPMSKDVRYYIYYTDGKELWSSYSTQKFWTQLTVCDLSTATRWRDSAYEDMKNNATNDHYVYYKALYAESKNLFNVCALMNK